MIGLSQGETENSLPEEPYCLSGRTNIVFYRVIAYSRERAITSHRKVAP